MTTTAETFRPLTLNFASNGTMRNPATLTATLVVFGYMAGLITFDRADAMLGRIATAPDYSL